MSLKAKLVSSIAAFMLVVALMVVGIFAASSGTINMGGSIKFTATDVVGKVDLLTDGNSGDEVSKTTGNFDATTQTIAFNWTTAGSDGVDLVFVKGQDITVKITVTNSATDRDMYVKFTNLPEILTGENVSVSGVTYGDSKNVTEGTAIEVSHEAPVVFSFTFSVDSDNLGVTATWSAAMTLSNTNA